MEQNKGFLVFRKSDFDKVSRGNMQLRKPSEQGKREELLEIYLRGGWRAVDERFKRYMGVRRYGSQVKALIPSDVKRKLKRTIH